MKVQVSVLVSEHDASRTCTRLPLGTGKLQEGVRVISLLMDLTHDDPAFCAGVFSLLQKRSRYSNTPANCEAAPRSGSAVTYPSIPSALALLCLQMRLLAYHWAYTLAR